jgi:hypothetical protein
VSFASAAPTGTYVSGISCVNLEATAGDFSITFYNQSGDVVTTINDSIAANGSKLYFTPSMSGLPSGFIGSAVVSSPVQMACSVNTQTNSGILRVGTSNGVDSTATAQKLYAPQVMNNLSGWSTYIAVQNTTASAADVTVKYFNNTGAQVASVTENVPEFSNFVFYQDDAGSGLPAGFIGSATVESSANLAGTVAMYNVGTSTGTAQFLSYNTFTGGASKVFGPRVVKNLSGVGYNSGFTCQNVGGVTTDISADMTFYDQSTKQTVTASMSKTGVAPFQSWAVYLGPPALDGTLVYGYGSVIIESTAAPVSCIFNEDNRTVYAGLGSTYSGVPDGDQSTTMFFPQIVALGSSSYRGGFQIANTTGTATTCDYTFSNGDVVTGQPLAGNGSNSIFAESVLINNKTSFNGSVMVSCGQPIVGIYNLAAPALGGDTFATNNGINQ